MRTLKANRKILKNAGIERLFTTNAIFGKRNVDNNKENAETWVKIIHFELAKSLGNRFRKILIKQPERLIKVTT